MKKVSLSIFVIIAVLFLAQVCFAASFDPTMGALGARPLSLGGAFVGLADDTNALFLNPAGLALIDKWSATSMYTKLLETVDYRMLGGTYSSEYGNFGFGYIGTSNPAGYNTGPLSTDVYEKMSYDTHTVVVSYGNKMEKIIKIDGLPEDTFVGADVKISSQGFSGSGQDDKTGFGYNLDLGALARFTPWAQAGLTLNNLIPGSMNWASGLSEDMPMGLNVGGAFNLMGASGLSLYESEQTLVGVLDAGYGFSPEDGFSVRGGLEWEPMEYLKIRCGIDQKNISIAEGSIGSAMNLTAGVGLSYAGITFDYAYFQDSNLESNQNHYFSISYVPQEFKGEMKVSKKKEDSGYYYNEAGYLVSEDGDAWTNEEEDDDYIIVED